MDVFNRLIPRPGNGNVQFKKLKHSSNSASIFASDEISSGQQGDTSKNKLFPAANSPRVDFAGALQKVREKLHSRPSANSNCSSAFSSSLSSLHRSNTTPTPFSDRTPNDKNTGRDKEAQRTDIRQQQDGAVLSKLRKQAKIMDIVGRKSYGTSGKSRKSDGQRLLVSEDGYCSGLE